MIEFKQGREFIGVWFATDGRMDWMAAAWREGDEPWQFAYRFRYYVDEKTHGSEDVKNWYSGEAKPGTPTDTIIDGLKRVGEALPGVKETYFVDMRGLGLDDQIQRLVEAPWAHVQTSAPGGQA